ncbi:Glycosyltransferase sugar-binding region containing DXD motif-containing protein [Clostridium cavendishii DSM 21758]|uniref:Glycosyltransferase sugar-binding region containing DXD motif-containing protein n=1 Tax=Clostridium cavendishii DSM 21758 TaxID=1121302 RepID=A0A1M6AZC4_9CLOT|nr:glycosyltransferase [Clostridium cavendishii]SHI41791.1 Glycosyltransferase sugar-binding region containing DXD motif-containing protein [Clostridium cavendishii DSM 21758]
MIPKIVHYCWFGKGQKNEKIKYCMSSWQEHLKDYTFIEWNEENFDVNSNKYCGEAYNAKKWAFVSDYVRLYALYNYGGIYLDTDVEITNNIDEFLMNKAFIGYHSDNSIPSALMASEKHNEVIKNLLSYYDNKSFIFENGIFDETTNIDIITKMIVDKYKPNLDNSKLNIEGMIVYPKEYFTLRDSNIKNFAIHHFNASWMSKEQAMNQVYSFKNNYELTIKWINYLLDEKLLLEKLGVYKNIAIYGNGYLGRLFKKQAYKENIDIKLIIDGAFNGDNYDGIRVIKPQNITTEKIDLIVVTPTYHFEEIKAKLNKLTNAKIISLEEIF